MVATKKISIREIRIRKSRKEGCVGVEAKFNMTVEQNIFVAKRNIIDYMWKSARLEGIGVTYPDTEAIFNGLTVQGVSVKDTVAINNLKHSWSFVLENVDYPMDYPFICKINQIVGGDSLIANAGFIRKVPVSIGGTTWKPDMPIESKIKEELADILTIESPTERAITVHSVNYNKKQYDFVIETKPYCFFYRVVDLSVSNYIFNVN